MSAEPESLLMRLTWLPVSLMGPGVVMIAASYFFVDLFAGQRIWTDAHEQDYTVVAAKLHMEDHLYGEIRRKNPNAPPPESYTQAQADFAVERKKYDDVVNYGETGARVLYGGGVALALAGGFLYLFQRRPD